MPRVICTLPNTSTLINGVKFELIGGDGHHVSEEIDEEQAAHFTSISGYTLAGDAESTFAELVATAESLGIKVDARWKEVRLNAEINKAKAAQAAKVNEGPNILTLGVKGEA